MKIIHAFFQDGLVLGQPLLKIEHAFAFWELKFIREICKCYFCKHKRCGARLKGKLRTTKDFRSIPGAYLRSGRISSVAWNQKFHWGWTIFPFQAIGWCSALIYSFPTCYWKYWTLENTHYVIKQVMLLYYLLQITLFTAKTNSRKRSLLFCILTLGQTPIFQCKTVKLCKCLSLFCGKHDSKPGWKTTQKWLIYQCVLARVDLF